MNLGRFILASHCNFTDEIIPCQFQTTLSIKEKYVFCLKQSD
ncbi:hypothetical protein FDUTEX481_07769 [Tolypothrix sp. PCC 7601]|nr:hypothetical protein FDUTEX481_07769 [Tolypothrix sp. PCC 7601]